MRELIDLFRGAGLPSPEADAAILTRYASEHDVDIDTLIARRLRREPLQHITGEAHFRHLTLHVGPGVFVPRPETELLAGWAIDRAREIERHRMPVVVDLCTGSGAIAGSVDTEVPLSIVHAVELSEEAWSYAFENLVATSVDLVLGDMADAFRELDGTVDVVVSNPPYIPVSAIPRDPEVMEHDPHLALFSGEDGLDAVRVVEQTAARLLKAGGVVGIEHADAQGEEAGGSGVPGVLRATGRWTDVRDHRDYADRPRYTTARLRG